MCEEKYHYFIELTADEEESSFQSRNEENERRHLQALEKISSLRAWLQERGLEDRVGQMNPTLFGQIQITCPSEVINKIQEEEAMPIAAIRRGSFAPRPLSKAS